MSLEGEAPAAEGSTPSLMDAPPTEAVVEGEATVKAEQPAGDEAPIEGEQPAEGEEAKEEEAAEGAPEVYADFEVPEGVTLNEDILAKFAEKAKANNWTQEQAQEFLQLGVELQQNNDKALTDAIVQTRAEWREASLTDAEFGGAAFRANMPVAVEARDRFGTPELKELLDQSGLGDHPEVIRFFYRVGKATGEHDFVKPGKVAQPGSFYDHPTSKPKG